MHAWNASRKCRRMASAEFRAPSANEAAVVAGDGEVIRVVRHPTALRARGMNRYPAMRWRHSRSFTQPPVSFALRAETNDSSVHEPSRHPHSAKILYLVKGHARLLGPEGATP